MPKLKSSNYSKEISEYVNEKILVTKEKILVTNDLDTERVLINGFCYTGKERGWYRRKIKESLVHEVDKYGDLIFAEEVYHPQRSITDFSNSGVNSNLEVNSKNYSVFFEV